MKKCFICLFILGVLISCDFINKSPKSIESSNTEIVKDSVYNPQIKYEVATEFMNNYTDYVMDTIGKISEDEYIKQNELLTDNFKKRYQTIIDSANRVEPEIGLDFDPIVDGQDSPDKGFKIKSIDKENDLVTLQGIDWKDFEVTVKVINQNNKSFVDGAGIINIPTNKQAKR